LLYPCSIQYFKVLLYRLQYRKPHCNLTWVGGYCYYAVFMPGLGAVDTRGQYAALYGITRHCALRRDSAQERRRNEGKGEETKELALTVGGKATATGSWSLEDRRTMLIHK
jgi:hypothetical protein